MSMRTAGMPVIPDCMRPEMVSLNVSEKAEKTGKTEKRVERKLCTRLT